MHVFVSADIYRSLCWLSELMTLIQPHNYIASTETVPADPLTWSIVGLAKFMTLGSLVLECTVERSYLAAEGLMNKHRCTSIGEEQMQKDY
jgi:hypothetical protein